MKEEESMNRKFIAPVVVLMLFAMACGSMNRATPAGMDNKAIEADVRSKIAEAVPAKTFAIEVDVHDAVVTLSGYAKNDDDRRAIGNAARSVNGVKSVINNITIQP
jgi:osmotically-inducible protein OsmY